MYVVERKLDWAGGYWAVIGRYPTYAEARTAQINAVMLGMALVGSTSVRLLQDEADRITGQIVVTMEAK